MAEVFIMYRMSCAKFTLPKKKKTGTRATSDLLRCSTTLYTRKTNHNRPPRTKVLCMVIYTSPAHRGSDNNLLRREFYRKCFNRFVVGVSVLGTAVATVGMACAAGL